MNFKIIIRPKAEADLQTAKDWYEAELNGLGIRLEETLATAFIFVSEYPHAGKIAFGNLRMLVTRKFPFVIFYTVEGDTVVVHAILHGKQNRERILGKRKL